MKRVDIRYGGEYYTIADGDIEELKARLLDGVASGGMWLNANEGEGGPRPAFLLISPGVDIALVPIPEPPE